MAAPASIKTLQDEAEAATQRLILQLAQVRSDNADLRVSLQHHKLRCGQMLRQYRVLQTEAELEQEERQLLEQEVQLLTSKLQHMKRDTTRLRIDSPKAILISFLTEKELSCSNLTREIAKEKESYESEVVQLKAILTDLELREADLSEKVQNQTVAIAAVLHEQDVYQQEMSESLRRFT